MARKQLLDIGAQVADDTYGTFYSDIIDAKDFIHWHFYGAWTWESFTNDAATEGAGGDFDETTNQITLTGHDFVTGETVVRLTTTDTLPTGLALLTDYWVIVIDANTIQLASSQANATAGTAVAFSDKGGSGTTTLNVQTEAGTLTLQYSFDKSTWIDVQAGTDMQAAALLNKAVSDAAYPYLRAQFAVTKGGLATCSAWLGGASHG